MDDINQIAKTLNTNTKAQGETLVKVVENVDTAHENAVEAHAQIEKAADHQKSGNKCLYWILALTGGCAVITIILLLIFTSGNKK